MQNLQREMLIFTQVQVLIFAGINSRVSVLQTGWAGFEQTQALPCAQASFMSAAVCLDSTNPAIG